MDRDSSVGIVTGDELDGQEIELRNRLDRSWGPYPGVQGPRRGVDHSPPHSAEVKERVKLCLYSSSVPACRFHSEFYRYDLGGWVSHGTWSGRFAENNSLSWQESNYGSLVIQPVAQSIS
jgi:hypothetical protein